MFWSPKLHKINVTRCFVTMQATVFQHYLPLVALSSLHSPVIQFYQQLIDRGCLQQWTNFLPSPLLFRFFELNVFFLAQSLSWFQFLLFLFPILPLKLYPCVSVPPSLWFSFLSVFFHSLPHLSFSHLTPPVPHPLTSVCVCVCVCVFIVFVLPHVVGSFLRLLSSSVFNGRYSVSVCGPLCRCPVFLNHVSSCLALVCFWFLFLLFLIDLIDLPLLHFV